MQLLVFKGFDFCYVKVVKIEKFINYSLYFSFTMLTNLATRVKEIWRDYISPPKHSQLAAEYSNLIIDLQTRPDTKPETRIRTLQAIADEQKRKYKRGMIIGGGLTALGFGTAQFEPKIINEIKNISENSAQILRYVTLTSGLVGLAGFMHLARNYGLLWEIKKYVWEKDKLVRAYIKGPKKIS